MFEARKLPLIIGDLVVVACGFVIFFLLTIKYFSICVYFIIMFHNR